MWVVNDLAHENDSATGKLPPRLICVLDRPFNAVAETEFAGEPDRDVAHGQRVVIFPHEVDALSVVIGGELVLDLGFEAETPSEISRWLLRARHGCKSTPPSVG